MHFCSTFLLMINDAVWFIIHNSTHFKHKNNIKVLLYPVVHHTWKSVTWFEGSQLRPFSQLSSIKMKKSLEHWWSDADRETPSVLRKTYHSDSLSTTNLTCTNLRSNPDLRGERPSYKRLNRGLVFGRFNLMEVVYKDLILPRTKHSAPPGKKMLSLRITLNWEIHSVNKF